MARHIVLEIDEGSISLTLAEIRKRRLEVLESREVRIPSLEGSALVFGIHDVLKGLDKEGALVHVALSDQNFLHFDINVPKLDAKALEAVLTREARRLGSFGEDQRVLLGYRRLEKVGKSSRRCAVVALPEQALRPVVSALAREGLTLGMVTSVEEAAVRLLPKQLPGSVLLLDYGASRVRFVYIEHGVVTQRRHILVPGLEQDSMVGDHWVDQLAMEIGWNLDYLKEMGKPEPQLMVLSLNLDLDDERRRALAGGLPIHPGLEPVVPGGEILLGQATQGMLRSLLDGDSMSVLGGMAREARKRQGSRRGLVASATATLVILAGAAWVEALRQDVDQRIRERIGQREHLTQRRIELVDELERIEAVEQRDRLRAVLAGRRPVSRFVAETCLRVPEGVSLAEVSVEGDGSLRVLGQARGEDRIASLDKVRRLRKALQELPFLDGVQEVLERYAGPEEWLTFRLEARWRTGR